MGNDALFNLPSGEIIVREHEFFGRRVAVLTGTHDITTFGRERQVAVPKSGRDVVIGRGAWVSTDALVLEPCRIGEHAVVAAGSVVRADVPPYAVVGARPVACCVPAACSLRRLRTRRNLVMGACNFHLDPAHRSPVPPAQLQFLAAASGFDEVRTWDLHPKEDVDLSGIRLDGVGDADAAVLAAALQKGLFGPQDYALLMRTPS